MTVDTCRSKCLIFAGKESKLHDTRHQKMTHHANRGVCFHVGNSTCLDGVWTDFGLLILKQRKYVIHNISEMFLREYEINNV